MKFDQQYLSEHVTKLLKHDSHLRTRKLIVQRAFALLVIIHLCSIYC